MNIVRRQCVLTSVRVAQLQKRAHPDSGHEKRKKGRNSMRNGTKATEEASGGADVHFAESIWEDYM